jgi:DNA-binding HxlR family transcriptional regulator
MKNKSMARFYCPVDFAFQRIGGKYKGRIIWYLKDQALRYGELKLTVEGISAKMLTRALKELEDDHLINRQSFLQMPRRVEYSLTHSGLNLVPVIDRMRLWAEQELGS